MMDNIAKEFTSNAFDEYCESYGIDVEHHNHINLTFYRFLLLQLIGG